ncbi:MAG: glycoside hydrolase family 57 protein [Candidatus Thermoplasmatota archaeon]|nr:glycoside hydrolase family 57 protein [Candidatus Thermoplasmatota archaeon]
MKICFYFQVHQPKRLKRLTILDFKKSNNLEDLYFDNAKNRAILERVAKKCYLQTNKLMLQLIKEHNFKFSLSLTGVFIEQCKEIGIIDCFKELADTGNVEFLNETYYHSLASLYENKEEFIEQIKLHRELIKKEFNYKGKVFRNTELIYSNEIAKIAEDLGYKAILAEGINLDWRSPNYVYKPPNCRIKTLLRNYLLSDDISFRFSAYKWEHYPLTADKYAEWLSKCQGEVLNIFMDYETFGEHQWQETGIFEFLKYLPIALKKYPHLECTTLSEASQLQAVGDYDCPNITSWADLERDTSAWLGNEMQKACFNALKNLESLVKHKKDRKLLHIWRCLQTTDHLYYISTKRFGDEEVHKYFAEHQNPYDAFISYMNIIQHLGLNLV